MECPTNTTGRWPTPLRFNLAKMSSLRSTKLVLKLSVGQELPHWLTEVSKSTPMTRTRSLITLSVSSQSRGQQ